MIDIAIFNLPHSDKLLAFDPVTGDELFFSSSSKVPVRVVFQGCGLEELKQWKKTMKTNELRQLDSNTDDMGVTRLLNLRILKNQLKAHGVAESIIEVSIANAS